MDVINLYKQYLIGHIGGYDENYSSLYEALWKKQFGVLVPMDQNRAMDGVSWRSKFAEIKGFDPDFCEDLPCTMLEMMIGLAERMSNQLYSSEFAMSLSECFWVLCRNCSINVDNLNFFEDIVDDILNEIIDRGYTCMGERGLFPLQKAPKVCLKEVELWNQMMLFLNENYVF